MGLTGHDLACTFRMGDAVRMCTTRVTVSTGVAPSGRTVRMSGARSTTPSVAPLTAPRPLSPAARPLPGTPRTRAAGPPPPAHADRSSR